MSARRPAPPSRSRSPGLRRLPRLPLRFTFIAALVSSVVLGVFYALQPPPVRAEIARATGNFFHADKHVSLADLVWDVWQFSRGDAFVPASPVSGDRTHAYGGLPRPVAFAGPVRVLTNTGYAVGYSDALKGPVWAAYRVDDLPEIPPAPERPDKFEVDPRTTARVAPGDYTRSGYDRGHLAPNYAIATRHGRAAQRETFLMSNITPQRHALNAGLWRALEMKIATSYAARSGEVWVLTGPVFAARPARLKDDGPAIAEAFFLIVVDVSDARLRAQALLVPQDAPEGAAPERYVTTIDEIERRTGFDFLSSLDDPAESTLESRRTSRVW